MTDASSAPRRPSARPLAPLTAAALLMVIGVSGLLVGLELLAVSVPSNGGFALFAIPAGIGVYGAAAIVGGVGILWRRHWAHRLALVTISVGLAELVWQTTLVGLDPVTLLGVAVWGAVLVFLLLPAVRASVGGR